MKYLIFDTTGIGKPKDYKAPFSDTFSWPKMIHISWILLDEALKPVKDYDCIIQPHGFSIDDHILKFSRLESDEIDTKAKPLEDVLTQLAKDVDECDHLIAHNMSVNEKILGAEYMRQNLHPPFFVKDRMCLMQEGTWLCKIPARGGRYKWPSLQELYTTLFHQRYSPSGNARADVIAAARCFILMKKKGFLDDYFE